MMNTLREILKSLPTFIVVFVFGVLLPLVFVVYLILEIYCC
jgi:hypothetical protein